MSHPAAESSFRHQGPRRRARPPPRCRAASEHDGHLVEPRPVGARYHLWHGRSITFCLTRSNKTRWPRTWSPVDLVSWERSARGGRPPPPRQAPPPPPGASDGLVGRLGPAHARRSATACQCLAAFSTLGTRRQRLVTVGPCVLRRASAGDLPLWRDRRAAVSAEPLESGLTGRVQGRADHRPRLPRSASVVHCSA